MLNVKGSFKTSMLGRQTDQSEPGCCDRENKRVSNAQTNNYYYLYRTLKKSQPITIAFGSFVYEDSLLH
jgi:hypothetical protein